MGVSNGTQIPPTAGCTCRTSCPLSQRGLSRCSAARSLVAIVSNPAISCTTSNRVSVGRVLAHDESAAVFERRWSNPPSTLPFDSVDKPDQRPLRG